jgi:hypothetical protein
MLKFTLQIFIDENHFDIFWEKNSWDKYGSILYEVKLGRCIVEKTW